MPSRKFGLNLVVFVAVAALFTGIWALYNRPVTAPDWPEQISGYSFSPFRADQNPQQNRYPTDEQIRQLNETSIPWYPGLSALPIEPAPADMCPGA